MVRLNISSLVEPSHWSVTLPWETWIQRLLKQQFISPADRQKNAMPLCVVAGTEGAFKPVSNFNSTTPSHIAIIMGRQ